MPRSPKRARLFDDVLMLPAAVIKERALDANIAWMQAFTRAMGVDLAPHGKTTMSPELFRRQLAAGAWAMTAATAHHVRLYVQWGVRRIIMANQLIGAANIAAVLDLLAADPGLEVFVLVDSPAGITMLADAAAARGLARALACLLEVGGEGERAGVRDLDAALAAAHACAARSELALRGIEAFEGVYPAAEAAQPLLQRVGETARRIAEAGLFAPGEVILTAGGSALFDVAARALVQAALPRPSRLVLRSGCYITHDSRYYADAFGAALQRMPELAAFGRLQPALEVWAHVQSRPEPTRVIASLGKRDIGADLGPPIPLWRARPGDPAPAPFGQGQVVKLYDQHACLDVPAESGLAVGDLIGFGVSHPCTTFDKWRALWLVDDAYCVTGSVSTGFGWLDGAGGDPDAEPQG